jgi:hypothetical protein
MLEHGILYFQKRWLHREVSFSHSDAKDSKRVRLGGCLLWLFGSVFTEVEAAVFAIHGRHNEKHNSMSFAKVLCCHVKALEYHFSNPL